MVAKTIDYSHQKQYRQREDQDNENKKQIVRKTAVCILQTTNKWYLTQEDIDVA